MARKRDYIPWPTKCAALICMAFDIPYEDAKRMHVDQVNALVHYDHYPIGHEDGGPDAHFNLVPRLIAPHRKKSGKDNTTRAKGRKIIAANTKHKMKMEAKAGLMLAEPTSTWQPLTAKLKKKIPSRPFPKPPQGMKRSLRSGKLEKVKLK